MLLILNALNITLFTFHLKYCLLASNKCARESTFICEHLPQGTIIWLHFFLNYQKPLRFQGENALGETKVFSSSQTLIFLFTIWPSYSGFDFIIKIDLCTGLFRCVVKRYSKYCSIRSRIRKKISCSERDKQQTFSIISQYITSCYKQLSGINCESCKFDFVA